MTECAGTIISQNDRTGLFDHRAASYNTQIYNNTIYVRSGLTVPMFRTDTDLKKGTAAFYNNIFYNMGGNMGAGSSPYGSFTWSNNVFYGKYGVQDDPAFWSASYGGENPSDVVKNKAFTEVEKIKVQLLMAQKEGLIKDIGYESLLKEMREENKKRKDAIAKNQVIFGLKEYDARTYLYYKMAELSKELKNKLYREWNISDEQIKDYYEEVKDTYYVQGKRVKVKAIKLSYVDESGKVRADVKNDLKNKCDEAMKRLSNGESFEKVAEEFNKAADEAERVFDNGTADADARLNPVLREIVMGMEPGEISDIIEEGNAFYIVKCLENVILSYTPYDKVKEILKSRYIDKKYSEYVNKLVEEAEVKIYDNVYKRVRADK